MSLEEEEDQHIEMAQLEPGFKSYSELKWLGCAQEIAQEFNRSRAFGQGRLLYNCQIRNDYTKWANGQLQGALTKFN